MKTEDERSECERPTDISAVSGASPGATVTRRGLLQGAAASPILLSPTGAAASEPIRYDLLLTLSQKEQLLTVVERPIFADPKDAPAEKNPQWRVHAVLFGPKAWFDLVKPASDNRRILKIFDAKYGDSGSVEYTFEFSRKTDKDRWSVGFTTNLWNPAERGAPVNPAAKTPFVDFTKTTRLKGRVGSGQIDAALRRIFQDHVRVARHAPKQFDVAFDNKLRWTLSAAESRNFSILDGQASLKDVSFGWQVDEDDTLLSETLAGEVFLTGSGLVSEDGFENSKVVIGTGHRAELRLKRDGSSRKFEVRIGVSPLDPALNQTISRLALGQASLAVKDAQGTVVGDVTANELVLSQAVLPKTRSTRTVLWGSAGLDLDPQSGTPRREEIRTPIGRLTVGALPPDKAAKVGDEKKNSAGGAAPPPPTAKQKAESERAARKKERDLFFRAACGDRSGARQATLWIVDDVRRGHNAKNARLLRRVALDVSLQSANVALPDVSFSSLAFSDGGSDLRLLFEDGEALTELRPVGEFPRVQPSSFVWVGPRNGPSKHHGDIDLSRATLTAARDYDLVKLRFRFLDLVLAFSPQPTIRPARADCRLIQTEDGKFADSRPVVVTEFDPQHVFEEALFRPEPPDLPDVEIKDDAGQPITREAILAKLAELKGDPLRAYREGIESKKTDAEKNIKPPKDPVFGPFAVKYREKAVAAGLPKDQQIYIGPYGLDPDAMHLARLLFKTDLQSTVVAVVKQTFERVKGPVIASLREAKRLFDTQIQGDPETSFDNALLNEASFEEIEPVYAAFRSFYREERRKADTIDPPPKLSPPQVPKKDLWRTEFLSEGNRPVTSSDRYPTDAQRLEWFNQIFKLFINRVLGTDPIDDLMAGHLSGPSRLAFRVNCMPPSNATSQEAGLHESSGARPNAPSGGGFAYDPIPFTFEALTDWSRYEPAVTLRARKLFTALPWGVVPPLGERAANLGDHDVLAFQGFTKGYITAEQRLGEVRTSMARKPTRFETAIEIPSRLFLSTAQDAVWQTVRRLPASADELNSGAKPHKQEAPALKFGLHLQPNGECTTHEAALWSARLAVEDVNPSLRIVDTPDFRPMVLAPMKSDGKPPLPGRGAPPRGPIAPWFIGPEQLESTTVTADEINRSLPDNAPGKVTGEVCADAPSLPEKVFQILKWLCTRESMRKATPIDWRTFRTTLDAYDRHQLVMLSSAYGLPVIGKRQSVGTDVDAVGPLLVDSGQFEAGDYALSDARNDQAIYRPVPLNVRELSLTALGGSFSHDTAFQPSAGADDLWGRKLFEGFSIERWQQDIVLGRDVLGQVVYKGYLFPFGHRASMIKQTERIFLRTPKQGVKAILRQRIFLHVAQPLQKYPAVGQPHRGSMWCGESVKLQTIWTPDILDPNAGDIVKNGESLNGRIDLGAGNPGLAFFPRTDITERGLVTFELLVDGAQSRLPLIFVDNIAATTATSLGRLIELYANTPKWIARRTLPINGQKIRYAPENRSGDTVLTTESVQVAAHGRFKNFSLGWAGDLGTYNTTGTLEGARQPPFYPAMDCAFVRLEQVERFSGGQRKPVQVQYDGHYVRHGFAPIPPADAKDDAALPEWNPLEVYLNLRTIITSGMGDNGERGAAIGRPASNIVALSRSKGPLGADRFVKYETLGYENPRSKAAEAQTRTVHINPSAVEGRSLLVDGGWQKLQSLATYFDHRHPLSATQPGGTASYPDLEIQPAGPVDVVPRPTTEPLEKVRKTLQVLQSYFSGDAKILGTVKIKFLLALLDLDDLLTAVPVLRETLEYGTAAANAAADISTDVRTRVILPLKEVIARLRAQWTALDATIAAKLGPEAAAAGLTLAEIYPEIEIGLKDLETTLQAASVENDPLRLADQLASTYESGRRFIRVLAAIAANPVERLKDSAARAINNVVAGFTGEFQSLSEFKERVIALVEAVRRLSKEDVATWIVTNIDDAGLADQLSLTFPQPDLVALARSLSGTLDPTVEAFLIATSADLSAALPQPKRLVELLAADALDVLTGKKKTEEVFRAAFNKWIEDQKPALRIAITTAKEKIRTAAEIQIEAVRLAALAALDEFRDRVDLWLTTTVLPEIAGPLNALRRALEIFAEVDAIATAVKAGDVTGVIRAVGAFSSDVFGYDIDVLAAGVIAEYRAKIKAVQDRVKDFVKASFIATEPADRKALADELAACLKFKAGQPVDLPAGTPTRKPLTEIADVLKALADIRQPLEEFRDKLPTPPSPLDDVRRFHGELTTLAEDLITANKELYCATVETFALVNEIRDWLAAGTWTSLDRNALDQLTRFHSRIDRSIKTIEEKLALIVRNVVAFMTKPDNVQYLAAGLLIGGAAKVLDTAGISSDLRAAAEELQLKGRVAENKIAAALSAALNFVFELAGKGSMFGAQIAEDLRKAVVEIRNGFSKVDRELGKAAEDLVGTLQTLKDELTKIEALKLVGTPATIKDLLDAKIEGLDLSVRQAFATSAGKSRLENLVAVARQAEADALAIWRLLQLKLQGAPDKLKQAIEKRVIESDVFSKIAGGYGTLVELRKSAIEMILKVPFLSAQARRVLLVAPVYGKECKIDDPSIDLNELVKCDRLAEEAEILAVSVPLDQKKRSDILRFFGSWTNGSAAPLVISIHVRDLAAQVLKGDVLSLIDVSAFRDAIEDAISQLIPTRATLSYDFSRAIAKEPSKTALFQAKKGSIFALKVRAVVNLLKPDKINFRANGSLGPFDVKLVGSLIDALTLKFDGAAFEMVGGSKPRFDVAYKDFEIGQDLEFAQKLQSFLTPKDGNGVFLQPMTRTAGIEAGYGIDLGSIGVGVTSFFNVTLNVSAELPFTDSESLFKVSLGRRLRPFTMSVIPFAGSGYFSIFAAPDGIRGFEASFEFGGGASIGFGPLQAQARVMVGVFIRVLRVDNANTCTIFGTFFAGGSASIWIFSFATSLYVRLGRSDSGAMYGEAIFSFSFSLGIVDYDYSITAFKREPQMGGGNQKNAALLEPDDFDEPTRFAFADDRAVMTDAPSLYVPRRGKRPTPKPATPDIASRAVGPAKNLMTYLSYFDLDLLEKV